MVTFTAASSIAEAVVLDKMLAQQEELSVSRHLVHLSDK